ncbi:uncharacterized protein LOC135168347 [Diachasmimorpha longicaudata]|uniref:uncharacterized protein LOC135168347 n=1 Tax=Diachasmimorpha longicaudata TaxID=58733 RepID=UPI0030B8DC51
MQLEKDDLAEDQDQRKATHVTVIIQPYQQESSSSAPAFFEREVQDMEVTHNNDSQSLERNCFFFEPTKLNTILQADVEISNEFLTKKHKLNPINSLLCLCNYDLEEVLITINISTRGGNGPKDKSTQQAVSGIVFEDTYITNNFYEKIVQVKQNILQKFVEKNSELTAYGISYVQVADNVHEIKKYDNIDYNMKDIDEMLFQSRDINLGEILYDSISMFYTADSKILRFKKVYLRLFFGFIDQLTEISLNDKFLFAVEHSNYHHWTKSKELFSQSNDILDEFYALMYNIILTGEVTYCSFVHKVKPSDSACINTRENIAIDLNDDTVSNNSSPSSSSSSSSSSPSTGTTLPKQNDKILNHLKEKELFFYGDQSINNSNIYTTISSGGVITPFSCNKNVGNMMNLLLEGGPQLWLIVDMAHTARINQNFCVKLSNFNVCNTPLLHSKYTLDLDFFKKNNINYQIIIQKPGDAVVIQENVYFQSISLSLSVSETLYYDSQFTYLNYLSNCPELKMYKNKFEKEINPSIEANGSHLQLKIKKISKIFKCEICKEFSSKDNSALQNHLRTKHYNPEIIHKCTVPGCEKVFSNKYLKIRHMNMVHASQELDQCIFCFKKFSNIFLHLKNIHEYTVNSCFHYFVVFKTEYEKLINEVSCTEFNNKTNEQKRICIIKKMKNLESRLFTEHPILNEINNQAANNNGATKKKIYIKSSVIKYQKSVKLVTDNKKTCQYCNKLFKQVWSKIRHEKTNACNKRKK